MSYRLLVNSSDPCVGLAYLDVFWHQLGVLVRCLKKLIVALYHRTYDLSIGFGKFFVLELVLVDNSKKEDL